MTYTELIADLRLYIKTGDSAPARNLCTQVLDALERKDRLLTEALDLINIGFDYSGDVYGVQHNNAVDTVSGITKELT